MPVSNVIQFCPRGIQNQAKKLPVTLADSVYTIFLKGPDGIVTQLKDPKPFDTCQKAIETFSQFLKGENLKAITLPKNTPVEEAAKCFDAMA